MNNEITLEIRKLCNNIEFLAVRLPYSDKEVVKQLILNEIEELQKLVSESNER
jgi:hypothetical protein